MGRVFAALVAAPLALLAASAAAHAAPEPATPGLAEAVADAAAPAPALPLFRASLDFDGEEAELPPVVVEGKTVTSEEDAIGPWKQPEWTSRRRFATTRVYVRPEGQWEFESWYRGNFNDEAGPRHRFQEEISYGLPWRMQVDYYHNFERAAGDDFTDVGPQLEMRWALADWGVLPLNPTLYAEYKWNYHGSDATEWKVLFGDTIAPRVHGAFNLSWEQETSGARATELQVAGAVSWTVIDRKLGIGVEGKLQRVTENGSRGHDVWEASIGPSVQWRFTERAHLDVTPLLGLNKKSHDLELFIVFGWDFGGGDESRLAPTSTKSQ